MRIDQLPVSTAIENVDTLAANRSGLTVQVSIGSLANAIRDDVYGAPLAVGNSALMTDTSKVYVYVGTTTSSLTNGHWYFWDGTAWTDGGAYNSTAVQTDTSLTLSGVPADAKAAGDAIRAIDNGVYVTGNTLVMDF